MSKLNKKFILPIALVLMSFVIAACGNSTDSGGEATDEGGKPQEGGTVTGAMDTAPGGMFNPIFYTDLYEEKIMEFTHESLVSQNDDLEFTPSLASRWEMNDDQTEVTFFLEKGVKWHDGEEFTADDVVFTYKSLSDPKYVASGGLRTVFAEPLLGYEAFSSGKTDQFTGVAAKDDYTVTFKFEKPNVNPLYYASFPILPKHVFENIPLADMAKAPESLEAGKIIGTGPFKFSNIVDREQYVLERHEDYWKGKPNLDKVVWKVVDQSVMIGLLEKGDIDFIAQPNGIPAADFETVSGYENIKTIEQTDFSYQVLGFKMNYRPAEDVKNGVINPANWKPNEKLADQQVRQAIATAINRKGIVDGLLYGKGEVIASPIAPQFWAYDEKAAKQYKYDPKKAKKMLDEAGYVDKNKDGFREDPNGKEWVLNLNYPSGNVLRERTAPIIQQQLEEVGIKVKLRQPKEMTAFLEDIEKDTGNWDMYLIGWGLETADPDPSELWSTKTPYNYSRWNLSLIHI